MPECSAERHNLDLCGHRTACARGQPHRVRADVRGLHADEAAPAVLADIPHGARAVAPGIPHDGGVRTPLFDAQPPRHHGIVDDARRRRVEKDAIRFARDPQGSPLATLPLPPSTLSTKRAPSRPRMLTALTSPTAR